ncbi:signal-induced proliferation-associated 1-like protein 2 isoform X2 [Maniola jurtina]|uniref:signal-induced proliferation-associated 1-like protein 2 isoform X1 n=1 Tax=Maniola jurtina TaxID=191418 RepID=UPI001E68ED6E|nr:signal-induced proliferation-associated 1-like protein 2 isoform X1 [Maniola jurtina]XP_045768167.1 signal-induced proliferation-associated 1-like protein 2 isoform X2 [Maniola jurtina]
MYAPDQLRRKEIRDAMYRSNSSLDLIYAEHPTGNGLRREYGSHGSIDVIGGTSERLPAMVHNYSGLNAPDRPSGLSRVTDRFSEVLAGDHADGPTPRATVSPKPRLKLNKFWGGTAAVITRPDTDGIISSVADTNKRKQFAHYDCQSLMANLSYAAEIRGALLSRRRNTTTGASAASLLATRGLPPGEDAVPDTGDGRSNELLESCPFFRNELGGEEERCVSLCARTARGAIPGQFGGWHRPRAAYGFSVLEFPKDQSHWRHGCPFVRSSSPLPIERLDLGALYYRNYFYTQPHQNWFGMDENLGPVAISIKKERIELRRGDGDASVPVSQLVWQYRLIIRTSELLTLRGSILEDALPTGKPSNSSATYNTKEVLEYAAPELQLGCLRLGITNGGAEEQLLRLDEQRVTRHYKVGVMYCKSGQSTEEEMYNNQEAGPAFVEFLQMLGQTVRLKDFDKYKAGLDNRTDSTGLYSVYTTYQGCEIMFHVSTMLPYTPNNRQQLLRKRHIGNDIVTIVFQEPGAAPFTPRNIRSQFQHVFVVVRVIDPCTENTHYSLAVSRAKEVPLFGPPIKDGAVYPKGEAFTDLLLSKVINGENAAIQSPKFSTMATRTRQEYLKDLANNYVSATTVDTGQKFSIFSSLLMKSGNNSNNNTIFPRVEDCANDVLVRGALCYHIQVQDEGAGGSILDCIMGVSTDSIVIVEESSRQIILVLPTLTLLGWVVSGSWTRIYYHRGESVRVSAATGDGLLRRLASVAPQHAHALDELTLERGAASQLGFHVQADGLVTAVEGGGAASKAGVKRGARLLEVCRAAVVALPHDHLVDLLKTSDPVTVRLTFAEGARCECQSACGEAWAQQPARRRLSPPRSDTSGYGTGGSGRSTTSGGGNGGSSEVRRRSHEGASPRHSRRPRSTATSSLTEELMRLMDAELGESRGVSVVEGNGGPGAGGGAPLPLPDASALDWAALVHTATRAMLQICEEHQYQSIDTADPASESTADVGLDTWAEVPINDTTESTSSPVVSSTDRGSAGVAHNCGCGLAQRVAALEADAVSAQRHRHHLEEEVRRLRRLNGRLREESARAVWQLRHFTQWFKRTVDKQ